MNSYRAINCDYGAINWHKRDKENNCANIENDAAINIEFTESLIYSSKSSGHRLVYKPNTYEKERRECLKIGAPLKNYFKYTLVSYGFNVNEDSCSSTL